MTKAKEIKGVVLCENFNEMFIDLIKKLEYPPELEKYLKYFESEDVTDLSVNLFNSDDFGKLALCDFEVFTSGFDSYSYHIHFNFDDDVRIIIIDRLNNYNILFDVSLQFNGFKWDYLFILPNSDKETTSELEQPVEDAEEPEEEECWSVECSNRTNGKIELTLGTGKNAIKKYYSSYDEMYEDNPEYKESFFNVLSINTRLTPLERVVFEAIENSFNLEFEYVQKSRDIIKDEEPDDFGCYSSDVEDSVKYYEELASMEDYKISYLQDLISKAGLDETYQAWLAERKEQKAVGASH